MAGLAPSSSTAPAQLPVAVLLVGAAVAAAVVRPALLGRPASSAWSATRMAGLFVVQGAPDLALTQVAIETLSTVLFVLVLRRLPDRFERRSLRPAWAASCVRLVVAGAVAVTVFALRDHRPAARAPPSPVSAEMVERALPDGHGRNVVNVILVDFRGFDTLGEITVLAAAAIGRRGPGPGGPAARRRRRPTEPGGDGRPDAREAAP